MHTHHIKKSLHGLLAVVLIATSLLFAMPEASASSRGNMTDLALDEADPFDGARAWARSYLTRDGSAYVLRITGIDAEAGTTFGSHVHVGPCVEGDGAAAGSHYKSDDEEATSENEVWLDFEVDKKGRATARSRVDFTIPEAEAQAIVVHAMATAPGGGAGARLACIPFTPAGSIMTDLDPANDNPTDGISANVRTYTRRGHTVVTMRTSGFDRADSGTTFGAHVHVGPCVPGDGAAAGSHYKADDEAASSANEVWLDFETNGGGKGFSKSTTSFVIPDGAAQSIVIHALPTDDTGGAGARLACIPFTPAN